MKDIFVSYRRKDSSDITGRIFDRLKDRFGAHRLFKDVDSIPLGSDFVEAIASAVAQSKAMVAVVGKEWLTATDENGRQRIQDDADYVHIEIAAALERNLPVIPVLVMGASMPKATELPEALHSFASRNGTPVRPDPDFDHDMRRLINSLEAIVSADDERAREPDVDFQRLQVELHKSHPLLEVDGLLELLADGGWPGWNPPSFGILGLGTLASPKSKGDLTVASFHSGYLYQVVVCARVEERYTLEVAFSRKHKGAIIRGLESKEELGDFWQSTKKTGVVLNSIKDVDCVYCNSPHASEAEAKTAECKTCGGEGMTTCRLNCERVYPREIVLLSFSDKDNSADLKSQKFVVLFETSVKGDLQPTFPVAIDGLADQQMSCIGEKYEEAKNDLERSGRNASVRNPESVIDIGFKSWLSHIEMIDAQVDFLGYKLLFRGAPAYYVQYHRDVTYEKGMLWRKKTYRARVEGQIWAHGYQPVYVLENTEEIASDVAIT